MTTAGTVLAELRTLPVAAPEEIVGSGTALILAPHQDDEVIGCGGLIAALVRADHAPFVLFVTDGAGSHPNSRSFPPDRLVALRHEEAIAATGILGLGPQRVAFMDLPDTKAPCHGHAFDRAVVEITARVVQSGARTILAPWAHDPHGDHLAVHLMARKVARTWQLRHLSYPVWGWTLPAEAELPDTEIAGWRLDIEADRALRQQALMAHRSQTTTLISDDPSGFSLDAATQAKMLSGHETFLVNR